MQSTWPAWLAEPVMQKLHSAGQTEKQLLKQMVCALSAAWTTAAHLCHVDSAICVRVLGVHFLPYRLPSRLQSLTPRTPRSIEVANDCMQAVQHVRRNLLMLGSSRWATCDVMLLHT